MEPLSWTGSIAFLNPLLFAALGLLAISILLWILIGAVTPEDRTITNVGGTLSLSAGPQGLAALAVRITFLASAVILLAYIVLGLFMGTGAGIIGALSQRMLPVWAALIVLFTLSIAFKRRLGLYGKLFDSPIGMTGFGLVMFWIFAAIFVQSIAPHGPIDVISQMRNELPGSVLPDPREGQYV